MAHQKTDLPVTLIKNNYYGDFVTTINRFEIEDVTYLSETQNRIKYFLLCKNISGRGDLFLMLNCYDEPGYLIESVKLNPDIDYIDVSCDTAAVEVSIQNPSFESETYLFSEYTNMYAPDGRVICVSILQVPTYEALGWESAVKMYSLTDGEISDSIEISPYEVSAYEKQGWHTVEEILYNEAKKSCDTYIAANDYDSVFSVVEIALPYLVGTAYEYKLYAIREEALNLWMAVCDEPMGLVWSEVGTDGKGKSEVSLCFRNLTYQKIVAFKVNFTCYDIFGNIADTGYDYYYDDSADIDSFENMIYSWPLSKTDGFAKVSDIYISEVVFEDGTKWRKPGIGQVYR